MRRAEGGLLLPAVLLLGCLGLLWIIYQELMASPVSRVAAGPVPAPVVLPALPEDSPFVMPPAEDFAAIVERPIFAPDRRPPSEAPAAVVARSELGLLLKGIITAGTERIAILQPKAAPDTAPARRGRTSGNAPAAPSLRLGEGDRYAGWTLARIEPAAVVFEREGEEARLELIYEPPPKPQRRRRARQEAAPRETAPREATENAGEEKEDAKKSQPAD